MNQLNLPTQSEIESAIGLGPGSKARRWRKRVVWAGLAAALAIGAWYFYSARQQRSQAVTYDTVSVEKRDVTVTVSATGTIQPITQVDVGSELSGVAREVLVAENAQVKAGEVLARLDTTRLLAQREKARAQLAAAQARILTAEASLKQSTLAMLRTQRLRANALSTEQEAEQADAEMKRGEAALEVAKAEVLAAQADLALVEADIAKSDIISPINGIILKRSLETGQTVAASLQAPVLFTIAQDISRIQLEANVDEADIGVVRIGQSAAFTVDAYRDRLFPAKIESMFYAPETVDGVVTYKTILSADNADLSLRPGMTATARVTVAEHKDVIAIPNEALRYTPPRAQAQQGFSITQIFMPRFPRAERSRRTDAADGKRAVYILKNGTHEEVRVKTGATDGKFTIIEDGGLSEGDALITASRQGAAQGAGQGQR
jgi:HlyD family secretion protein